MCAVRLAGVRWHFVGLSLVGRLLIVREWLISLLPVQVLLVVRFLQCLTDEFTAHELAANLDNCEEDDEAHEPVADGPHPVRVVAHSAGAIKLNVAQVRPFSRTDRSLIRLLYHICIVGDREPGTAEVPASANEPQADDLHGDHQAEQQVAILCVEVNVADRALITKRCVRHVLVSDCAVAGHDGRIDRLVVILPPSHFLDCGIHRCLAVENHLRVHLEPCIDAEQSYDDQRADRRAHARTGAAAEKPAATLDVAVAFNHF